MLRIGLVELAPLTTGGAATYALSLQQALADIDSEFEIKLVTFANEATSPLMRGSGSGHVLYRKHQSHASSPYQRLWGRLGTRGAPRVPTLPEALRAENIDLAWFLAPNRVISAVKDIPYVMTVWDLGHRDVQGFPEFSSQRRWEQREAGFAPNLGRAFHVLTDSKRTGESLEKIYGVYPHNWSSIGLPLPSVVMSDMRLADTIAKPYFYYPASYWPHKNHRVLVDALEIMKNTDAHLVFSGHDEGHRELVEKFVGEQALSEQVHFYGRISDEEVQGLIDNSVAVVMPSVLGPTNYPPLEALRRGKPALVSPVHDFDQTPRTGLVVMAKNFPELWAAAMTSALEGKTRVDGGSFEPDSPLPVIRAVIEKFAQVQRARFLS